MEFSHSFTSAFAREVTKGDQPQNKILLRPANIICVLTGVSTIPAHTVKVLICVLSLLV